MKRLTSLHQTQWNWRLLFKRLHQNIVRTISALAFGLLLLVFCLLSALEWVFQRLYRRIFGWRCNQGQALHRQAEHVQSRHRQRKVIVLENVIGSGSRRLVQSAQLRSTVGRTTLALNRDTRSEDDKVAAIAATRSNLALCRSPSAVIAVTEEATDRGALFWTSIEEVLARLIELGADRDDVRDALQFCHYDWLYTKPSTRRVIRLLDQRGADAQSWQHFASHLICFECDSPYPQHYPPYDRHRAPRRINVYFSDDGRCLDWSRVEARQ
ncbi:MAG: hypothetical protein RIC14_05150 [Filomicrobium sp.]